MGFVGFGELALNILILRFLVFGACRMELVACFGGLVGRLVCRGGCWILETCNLVINFEDEIEDLCSKFMEIVIRIIQNDWIKNFEESAIGFD